MSQETEFLFTYGTLQYEEVQLATFGRKLEGHEDGLPGYTLSMVEIDDPEIVKMSGDLFHPILKRSTNPLEVVKGMVYEVTKAELDHADSYEVDAYKRISVVLSSGIKAWVYIDAND